MTKIEAAREAVTCPYCKALPGFRCTYLHTGSSPFASRRQMKGVHSERIEALERLEAQIEKEESSETVRAKGILDGAVTLEEAAAAAEGFAKMLRECLAEGYHLTETPVHDDYMMIRKD